MGSPVGVFQAETVEKWKILFGEKERQIHAVSQAAWGDIVLDRIFRREGPGLEYFIHYYQQYFLSFCVSYPQPTLLPL